MAVAINLSIIHLLRSLGIHHHPVREHSPTTVDPMKTDLGDDFTLCCGDVHSTAHPRSLPSRYIVVVLSL